MEEKTPLVVEEAAQGEAPPKYTSLFGQMRQMKASSSGAPDFIRRGILLTGRSLVCTILTGLLIGVPISMIVMGALYFDDCPCQRYIPIYLIVGGCFNLYMCLASISESTFWRGDVERKKLRPLYMCNALVGCFLLVWFILGSVWIYTIYNSHCIVESCHCYCHQTFYMYAFWLTTATYIALFTFGICFCIISVSLFFCI
ncbi:transmembrane protein 272-like [Oscarella lobularis]|uniref:transmembrane protein 272-like n=1 Tax=Oscarella lobularis TaxID=121494 RepID=UPI00331430A4